MFIRFRPARRHRRRYVGIKVPTYKELERQWACDPGDETVPPDAVDYRKYLEDQKELLAQMLLSGSPLSELDRTEIAHLLCPELYLSNAAQRPPGRPMGIKTATRRRNIRIALDYDELNTKGGSESAFLTLSEKYGLEKSGIVRIIGKVKRDRKNHGYNPRSKS